MPRTRFAVGRSASALRCALCAALLTGAAAGQRPAHVAGATPEQRASRALEQARTSRSAALELEAFLRAMPKGADLHMHLSGAIYAETFLKDAAADHLCVDPKGLRLVKPTGSGADACPSGDVPAAGVTKTQGLYDALVDSFSMRSFVPSAGVSGHDQFFATFERFGGIDKAHTGEWLDEVATRAAAQNEQYLEVMITPSFGELAPLWMRLGWPATRGGASSAEVHGDVTGASPTELEALRGQLLAGGLRDEVARDAQEIDEALATRDRIEHCGQPGAGPGCRVTIRFLYQILRAFSPQQVFAQTLLGFETALADPNVVGLNFVQPEDAYMAMSEYTRQMHMLDYLHGVYPHVHVSLHAGEVAPGLVPPEGLRFHIREAVELGHAERIGHGVDVMHEDDPRGLLRELRERHVSIEINLTSNDVILGVVPPYHPLPSYRAAGVPVSLNTDDEGVSRIDLTNEYVRAAREYGLGYADLKGMARTSLEHSFLPGESLWARPDEFTGIKPVCAKQTPGSPVPTADCLALLKASQRAAQQWELERRFAAFEASFR
ncbi:MAG: adenosine deaminase [Acidobacteriota bacterium]|nr:adenosine deaminase [Acidobacteriota bacterium]